MTCSGGDPRRHPGLTNPYRISRMPGTTHWLIWFGPVRHYHRLPIRTRILLGAFGRVRPPFTNTYHSPDLGAGLPRETFTNDYHRDEGTEYRLTYSTQHPAPGHRVGHSYRSR